MVPQVAQPATPPRERIIRTSVEEGRLQRLRERIEGRNPYRFDQLGRLEIGELGLIPLAGLNEEQAELRLSAERALEDFTVDIIRLPLERIGDEALKPFGYDLFAGYTSTFAPATDIPVPVDYVVGPGDEIHIQLFGAVNQNYLLPVGRNGQINFPQLGPIDVAGQTFSEVRADLERRVASQLIGTTASVSIGETRSIRVFVLGEAFRPGSYTVSGLSTITNALFVSGGVTEIGSLRGIQLKRRGQVVKNLDLYDLLLNGDTSDDARLLPGDVIFIPPVGKTISITGEVRRPAIYELAGESSARKIIALAGGLTPRADPSMARVERIDERQRRVTFDVDLSGDAGAGGSAFATGDLLRVQPIRMTLENSIVLGGHVFRPGALQHRPGMRISDVIPSLDELRPHADLNYVLIRRESPPDWRLSVVSADLALALQSPGSADDVPVMARDRIFVFDRESSRDRTIAPLLEELRLQSRIDRPMQIVEIGGRVKSPGRYPLEPGMRVSDLIRAGGSLEDAAYGGQAELTRHRVVDGETRKFRTPRGRRGRDTARRPVRRHRTAAVRLRQREGTAAMEPAGERADRRRSALPGRLSRAPWRDAELGHATGRRAHGSRVRGREHLPARGPPPKGGRAARTAREPDAARHRGARTAGDAGKFPGQPGADHRAIAALRPSRDEGRRPAGVQPGAGHRQRGGFRMGHRDEGRRPRADSAARAGGHCPRRGPDAHVAHVPAGPRSGTITST